MVVAKFYIENKSCLKIANKKSKKAQFFIVIVKLSKGYQSSSKIFNITPK